MEHKEFKIGTEFSTATGRWRCTDVGTRVAVAIMISNHPPDWYNGPPYAVPETVFDEDDMKGCQP